MLVAEEQKLANMTLADLYEIYGTEEERSRHIDVRAKPPPLAKTPGLAASRICWAH